MSEELVRTERLVLTRPVPADLDDVFALYSDPAVWEHFPSRRHTHRDATAQLLEHVDESWRLIGLGSWVARDADGTLVGTGGCDLRLGLAWNLGYRLARSAWGRGFAQEVIRAALAAAGRVRPDLAVTAYLLEHNVRSKATAERAGLDLVWTGPDAGNPDRDAVRLLYADRPLSAIVVRELTAT
ncbi:GNAT family N-acetyltransferase [Kineococcus rhizosphaerae]|uniref:RimJ/RimL family protein N-acetyltransferase n=1 Tax=Kineococcus rhizosphaerae TaxID=559628 RepID=A0A2T0R2V3_9ACTN|nr:GNAT family N-acetyltransferase [Kineococcus rhizosphaerae]PRY14126.1 RimJ/RimL family protein N-acetyltransferase [Kineococcus rhizosphaerae]